ncbi:MAG: lamin tail domain-containing protein, partial [Saprospiraceae bacterium]|nr:lamin tail domain-containing protein [Saprospiraceae bacterium]
MSNTKLNFLHILILIMLTAQPVYAQLRINEVLAINSTSLPDPDFGEFSDFVELHNASAVSVSLNGYCLTDDVADPKKWPLPNLVLAAGQFLVVWADDQDKQPGDTAYVVYKNMVATMSGLHANFRLSADGEHLALFNPQGVLVDDLVFCTQTDDISYGTSAFNPTALHYFAEPTPGAPNSAFSSPTMEQPGEPLFSLSAGFYAVPQQLQLSAQEPDAVVRFTFDGATPTETSPAFT